MNYYPPNCKASFNGFEFDVSFVISCEGMTAAEGSRWTTMTDERRKRIIAALEFLGWLYGPDYSPDFEKTLIGERLVFNALDIKYQRFKRLWYKLPTSVFDRFDEEKERVLKVNPRTAFREIWEAFYGDVAKEDVYDFFLRGLTKLSKIDNDEE